MDVRSNTERTSLGRNESFTGMKNLAGSTCFPCLREEFPCAYFRDGRTASIECLFAGEEGERIFHHLLALGYRRLGGIFYRNVCEGCSACLPLRIEVSRFAPSRSQQRTLRMNHDVRVEILPSSVTKEKIDLYMRYIAGKHGEQDDGLHLEPGSVLMSMHHGYPRTIEMDYFLGDRLVGVGIVDEGDDALSANYFYYDTDILARRLGIFSILEEIELARRMGKRYYYLGFMIEDLPKMSYKRSFRPNEVLAEGYWKRFLER